MTRTYILLVSWLISLILSGCATSPKKEKIEAGAPAAIFFPSLPEEPRIQYLYGITAEEDLPGVEQKRFDKFLFGDLKTGKNILQPWDIGSSKDKIYLIDRTLMKVIFIDLANKKFDFIKDPTRKLQDPVGIWVTEDDIKYLADKGRKQVVVFGQDNNFLKTYGNKELFEKPMDVAVHGNSVYVIDMAKHQLFVLDKESGRQVNTIGEPGPDNGKFWRPTHVTVDKEGNIFVNDAFNFRVQKFDPSGKFLASYGSIVDAPGNLARPKGIAVSREGHLYIADVAFRNIQIFDEKSGELLLFFGRKQNVPDKLGFPAGVHTDYENVDYFKDFADKNFQVKYLLYVCDYYGQYRLQIFGFGQWTGPSLSGG